MATIKRVWKPVLALTIGLIGLGALTRVGEHSPPQCDHAVFIEAAGSCQP